MSNLSRRSLVASAAALPALALPAVAVASEPDPIFAALKAFDAANEAEKASYDVRDDADEAFKARHGCYHPSCLAKGTPRDKFDGFWSQSHHNIKNVEGLSKDRKAELHRELNRQQNDYETIARPFHDAADAAADKRFDAQAVVFATVPTTLAGFKAKIDFAMSESHVTGWIMETESPKELGELLDTLYKSACKLV